MILSTCEYIPNKKISENLGIARGSTVRARNALRDLMAGLKSVVGGEIEEYTKLQAYAREQAVERMVEDAKNLTTEVLRYEYDHEYMVRGLVVDKKRGNILKMDRHKYVKGE